MKISRQFLPALLVTGLAAFAGTRTLPAASVEAGSNIQQMMSDEEFRASGLTKLSKKELGNLNGWLQGYRNTTLKTEVAKVSASTKMAKMDLLTSRIDGSFVGAATGMIIKLEDGTQWKVANPGDHFAGSGERNPVAVIHTIFGYKMRVEGTPDFYVDPVRPK